MKLKYRQTELRPGNAFTARQDTIPCLEEDWHYHPELELIYFLKSSGTRYVGNSVGNFAPGELYLIGSNVPHLFRNEKGYYDQEGKGKVVDLIVVQFKKDFLGADFLNLSESKNLRRLFDRSERGLKFSTSDAYLIHNHLLGLVGNKGLSSVVGLLRVLDVLAVSETYEELCADVMVNDFANDEKERMGRVIKFLTENFDRKISLNDVAEVAHMTPNSFCRYFKKRTQKSFLQYLHEIRIRHACQLLIEGERQISEICYDSGFNTFTNFNRQFKSLMGVTPSDYMARYHGEYAG